MDLILILDFLHFSQEVKPHLKFFVLIT